jgi:hypothetical protein
MNAKFVNVKKAEATHQYTSIKRKLYNTNAAISDKKTNARSCMYSPSS